MVAGDRLDQAIELSPGARAVLSTASAGKVYRSMGDWATQEVCVRLEGASHLTWAPRETIVFEGARIRQAFKVEIDPFATFLGWEVVRFGRSARGERYTQGYWRSDWEIRQSGKPLFLDRQGFEASERVWSSPLALAGVPVIGTLVAVGQRWASLDLDALRASLPESVAGLDVGLSRLPGGLVARVRGPDTEPAFTWLQGLRDALSSVAPATLVC
jgi:urease accessory protein